MTAGLFGDLGLDGPAWFGAIFGTWPEPPDIVPLRLLGLAERPAHPDQVRSAFRARLRVVHPDVAAYAETPWLQDAADAQAAARPEVAEMTWAREVLLRKIPPPVTASKCPGAGVISRNGPVPVQLCKGCQGAHVTQGGTVRGFHHAGRWSGWCYPCAAAALNEARREARRQARAGRACGSCGATFTPARADARYCSAACRQRAHRGRVAATTTREHTE